MPGQAGARDGNRGLRWHVGMPAGVNRDRLPQRRAGRKSAYLTVQFGSVDLRPRGEGSANFVEWHRVPGSEPVPKSAPDRAGLSRSLLDSRPERLERIPPLGRWLVVRE